jgi:hypothetical protein
MRSFTAGIICALTLASPRASDGQDTVTARRPVVTRDTGLVIPVNSRPPAGMCRIWLENVPVSQQPAPTDCASAVKNRPAKGRVVFGDDYVTKESTSRKTLPFVKGFAPPKPSAQKTAPKRDTVRKP